jgi:Nucleotidyltransferase of unknown function (DUF6036)
MASPFAELFSDLAAAFERTSAPWYVFGAQAAIVHGASRLTADVDVTIIFDKNESKDLIEILKDSGFEPRVRNIDAIIEQSRVLPVLHLKSGIPVDVIIGGTGLEEQFASRAQFHKFDNVSIPVACAEDVIIMKILAGRDKDIDDVKAIIGVKSEQLDLDVIRETLGVLEVALDRSDLLPILEIQISRVN